MLGWLKKAKQDRADRRAREEQAFAEYRENLAQLLEGADPARIGAHLQGLAKANPELTERFRASALTTVQQLSERALSDEILTEGEEASLEATMLAAGLSIQEICDRDRQTYVRLVVSRVNDGRLPVVEVPIMLKATEVGHQSMQAHLLKEVAIREYQGGYAGVSVRIAKGVRYHTGGVRGRSVVVGQETHIDDSGTLTLTSQRAVFTGSKRSIEFAYPKLVSVDVAGDVVRLHCSNRKNTPAILTGAGDIVGAIVAAAAQRLL